MRAGFSRDEIYDVLTSAGLFGEQIQLMIDRVSAEFHEAKIESRPSKLASEVGLIFREIIENFQHEALARMDLLSHRLGLIEVDLGRLMKHVNGPRSKISPKFCREAKRSR